MWYVKQIALKLSCSFEGSESSQEFSVVKFYKWDSKLHSEKIIQNELLLLKNELVLLKN